MRGALSLVRRRAKFSTVGLGDDIAVPSGPLSGQMFFHCINEELVSMGRCAFLCTIKDLQVVLDAVGFTELSQKNPKESKCSSS